MIVRACKSYFQRMAIVEDKPELPFDFQVFTLWIELEFKICNFRILREKKYGFPQGHLCVLRENLVYYNF